MIPPDFKNVIQQDISVSSNNVVFRDNSMFRVGSLAAKLSLLFWREEILAEEDNGERVKFLRWLGEGVRIEDF